MRSRLICSLLSLLSLVSASDPDLVWPSFDFNLPQDTDPSLGPDQEVLLSSALPFDLDLTTSPADSYFTDDSFDNISWDINSSISSSSSTDPLFDGSLVADCSGFDNSPAKGKSRLRRGDDSSICNDPLNADSGEITLPTELFSPNALDTIEQAVGTQSDEQYEQCIKYSVGILKNSLCSQGFLQWESISGGLVVNGVQFATRTLRHCSRAPPLVPICPAAQTLFCCKDAVDMGSTGVQGAVCIELARLIAKVPLRV